MGLIGKDIRELKKLKNKRILILLFLNFVLATLIISFILIWKVAGVDFDLLISIYIFIALILVAVFIYFREYFSLLDMKYKYLNMVNNKRGPYNLKEEVLTQAWIDSLVKNEGFKLSSDAKDYSIYYKYIKSDREVAVIKKAMLVLVIAKNSNVNFYDDEIDRKIKRVYQNSEYDKTEKHIVLQFKKYDELTDEAVREIDQIINFKSNRFHAVQIICGYIPTTKQIYFLEPKRKYPTKFYFYACNQIKKYTGVINNEK